MNKLLNYIIESKMFENKKNVGVAVSGGSDSIALLNFLFENKDKLNINVIALHVDHCLRQTSKRDREFVQNFCKERQIEFQFAEVNVKEYCEKENKGIEDGARFLRYDFLNRCINLKIVDCVALAHHKLDQAETVLMNIFRGGGVAGACGMKEINGNFVRPFLNLSKATILDYVQKKNLEYVEDETNFSTDYNRNFLRNEILPKLNERFGNLEETVCRFAENCKQDDTFILSETNFNIIKQENNIIRVSKEKIKNNAPSQNFRIFKKCLDLLEIKNNYSQQHFKMMNKLICSNVGKQINLPNGAIIESGYSDLIFKKKSNNDSRIADFNIEIDKKDLPNIDLGNYEFKLTNNLSQINNVINIIDFDKLPQKLKIRRREDGDKFQKFGSGTKKLKEFLIDKKIPKAKRDEIKLLANGKEVLSVIGVEISEKVKYDNDSKNFLCVIKK